MSVGVTRDLVLSVMNLRGIHINTATAAYSLVPSDSGILFINDYGTDTTYTLPLVADGAGKMFWFLNAEATTKTIIAAQTACIKGQDATAKTSCTSKAIGDWAIVTGDGTNYFFFSTQGGWTLGT